MAQAQSVTLMPFLYPCLLGARSTSMRIRLPSNISKILRGVHTQSRKHSTSTSTSTLAQTNSGRRAAAYAPPPQSSSTHLNPAPDDYARSIFADKVTIAIHAGSGGNGCASFMREAHIPDGPANGGDGGNGGSVWIQAVPGHTSLHKLGRQGSIRAGRGQGGQGKSQGGKRGEDICIQVPVGTVVREIWRSDPAAEEAEKVALFEGETDMTTREALRQRDGIRRDRWILYPGTTPSEAKSIDLPPPPRRPRRTALSMLQPQAPITLDLAEPMEKPRLLAAGGVGGMGNPHFVTKEDPKPKFASKGAWGVRIQLELELKLLADVGLVGLPNAGKSTLVRAVSGSRTRVGDWAFTTLAPSIGTVVVDDLKGRVDDEMSRKSKGRENFTIADIPGLVEDAHLDKGLGISFLRHVERARVLAFVLDLSAGDAVAALKSLWREVAAYEALREREINEESENRTVEWNSFGGSSGNETANPAARPAPWNRSDVRITTGEDDNEMIIVNPVPNHRLEPLVLPPISGKSWFVVGTKADLPGTQENFEKLQEYVQQVQKGKVDHPSGLLNGWRGRIAAIPVSAITEGSSGVEGVKGWAGELLDGLEV